MKEENNEIYEGGQEVAYYEEVNVPETPRRIKPDESNNWGLIGFICTLLAYLLSFLGAQLLFWPLGFVFSIIGLFKKPRTFAIIGLLLSILYLAISIFVFTVLASIAGPIFSVIAPFLAPAVVLEILGLLAVIFPFLGPLLD